MHMYHNIFVLKIRLFFFHFCFLKKDRLYWFGMTLIERLHYSKCLHIGHDLRNMKNWQDGILWNVKNIWDAENRWGVIY